MNPSHLRIPLSRFGVNVVRHRVAITLVAIACGAGLGPVASDGLAVAATIRQAAPPCVGDCDDSSGVTVDEIVTGVSIALGLLPLDECPRFDCDAIGRATVDCIVKAVDGALNGCDAETATSPTPTSTPIHTGVAPPKPSPTSTAIDEAALAASVRAATEPLFRLLDFQARVGSPGGVAGRSTVSGCQQFDCFASGQITGSEEDCCSEGQFTQVFDNCVLDDDLGRFVSLNGAFVLDSDNVDVCTGAIPLGASFRASLSSFTRDVFFPDGSFSRTFQELTETFEVATGGCTVRQPDPLGFGIRGDGLRFFAGELQLFQTDGFGNVLVDSESDIDALEMEVGSTGQPDNCTVTADVRGSLTSADFRGGTQFRADFINFHAVQPPQAGALLLGLNGTVGTDCLGDVRLSTLEPLRVAPGNLCFTAGRLEAQSDGAASATYAENGLDIDFDVDHRTQHFATCADVPATEQCATKAVALCGACTAVDDCHVGLSCFPCSGDCTGNTRRCSLLDALVTCEDGVF